ncbi:hypothetical protein E2R57_15870 [Arthrobacter nitrophenolicus]|uniref:3-hydroxyacyl-CoA dehydrogenase NAD binding domain-containing protein n=2 Tax=Arthrobacter nitrophenolicus TaxID=683150 RepID=A0A4R5XQW6_9MICC|nr:hypothetical protein E2R57_15870 [Arthrobacter nitrophenolicus]
MGPGVAHAFLINGADIVIVERDEESAQAARARVESAVLKSNEPGTTDHYSPEMPTSKLTVGVDYDRSTQLMSSTHPIGVFRQSH